MRKPIGAWISQEYAATEAPAIMIFGDSQLGGLRSADAKVAERKLDFALDHRSYAIENELHKINSTWASSRLDISNALSRIGFSNTLTGRDRPSEFRQGGLLRSPRVFVASQPGSIVSDYFVMSKSLISEKKKPATVIITVNPRSFLDNGLTCPGDSDYFRFFARHASLDSSVYETAYPDFRSKCHAAMKSILRSPINQVAVGQFVFLPDDQQHFNDRLPYPANFSFNPNSCRHQIWFLNETLKYCKSLNIKTIVVSLPIMQTDSVAALNKLHRSIESPIRAACASEAAEYYDLTNDSSFLSDDFLDPVHLSQEGGVKIAKKLARYASGNFAIE